MIIAEIGLNHKGSYDLANYYVDQLIKTDVDAITFQIREQGFYKGKFKGYELSAQQYKNLKSKIRKAGKLFGLATSNITEYDKVESDFIKVLSKDIEDLNFIDQIIDRTTKQGIFLSTGMSNFKTVQTTLDFCKDKGKRNIKLIHTRLSNSTGDVNLKAIQEMKNRFGNIVAFGNHCRNPNVLFTSVAYEPTDYYFYVKDKKTNNHPDDLHAIYLDEVQGFCNNIKDLTFALGTGSKENTNNKIEGQI